MTHKLVKCRISNRLLQRSNFVIDLAIHGVGSYLWDAWESFLSFEHLWGRESCSLVKALYVPRENKELVGNKTERQWTKAVSPLEEISLSVVCKPWLLEKKTRDKHKIAHWTSPHYLPFLPPPPNYFKVASFVLCYLPHVTVHVPNSTSLTTVLLEAEHKI